MSRARFRWRTDPADRSDRGDLWHAIEAAAARGAGAFGTFRPEPERHAWWGRLHAVDGEWFVKARTVAPGKRFATLFLERGVGAEWRKTLWLRDQNLPCVEPIGWGERRRRGMLTLSLLVTRWQADALCLADFVERERRAHARFDSAALIWEAGKLFGEMLARGAVHKQFHPWNILVRVRGAGGFELIPIDLQHLWTPRRLTEEDYLWAIYQVSFWLHSPVLDWRPVNSDADRFLDGVFDTRHAALADQDETQARARLLIAGGRTARKVRRRDFRTYEPPRG